MVFSSLLFLFRFLPAFMILYLLAPYRAKNLVLFLGSLVFYAWGEPVYVTLMLFSALSDYVHGICIEKAAQGGRQGRAKLLLVSSLTLNLALLGFFKYADFLIGTVNGVFHTAIPLLALPLPVGISFYTFQTMSYTIDVYRKRVPAQKDIVAFGAFVTMFPQLIAGPIVQYKDVGQALKERRVTAVGLREGVDRMTVGLGKKVLLANQAGALYEQIAGWGSGRLTMLAAWTGMLCFAFQIYFDFSGYSDMAAGLGKMMGFTFPENFRYPYVARSVTDFWRRWHMSLSGWFREYVYIPLGGSRCKRGRQFRNILTVWMLTGIWHGAAWHFLLWGLWFAFFLILEKMWIGRWLEKLWSGVGLLYTWLLVLGSWVLFSRPDLGDALLWAKSMLGMGAAGMADRAVLYELYSNALLFVLLAVGATPLPAKVGRSLCRRFGGTAETVWQLLVFGLSVAFLVDASYNPFLYFRF